MAEAKCFGPEHSWNEMLPYFLVGRGCPFKNSVLSTSDSLSLILGGHLPPSTNKYELLCFGFLQQVGKFTDRKRQFRNSYPFHLKCSSGCSTRLISSQAGLHWWNPAVWQKLLSTKLSSRLNISLCPWTSWNRLLVMISLVITLHQRTTFHIAQALCSGNSNPILLLLSCHK